MTVLPAPPRNSVPPLATLGAPTGRERSGVCAGPARCECGHMRLPGVLGRRRQCHLHQATNVRRVFTLLNIALITVARVDSGVTTRAGRCLESFGRIPFLNDRLKTKLLLIHFLLTPFPLPLLYPCPGELSRRLWPPSEACQRVQLHRLARTLVASRAAELLDSFLS